MPCPVPALLRHVRGRIRCAGHSGGRGPRGDLRALWLDARHAGRDRRDGAAVPDGDAESCALLERTSPSGPDAYAFLLVVRPEEVTNVAALTARSMP